MILPWSRLLIMLGLLLVCGSCRYDVTLFRNASIGETFVTKVPLLEGRSGLRYDGGGNYPSDVRIPVGTPVKLKRVVYFVSLVDAPSSDRYLFEIEQGPHKGRWFYIASYHLLPDPSTAPSARP